MDDREYAYKERKAELLTSLSKVVVVCLAVAFVAYNMFDVGIERLENIVYTVSTKAVPHLSGKETKTDIRMIAQGQANVGGSIDVTVPKHRTTQCETQAVRSKISSVGKSVMDEYKTPLLTVFSLIALFIFLGISNHFKMKRRLRETEARLASLENPDI